MAARAEQLVETENPPSTLSKPNSKKLSPFPPLPWKTRLKFAIVSFVMGALWRSDFRVNRRVFNFIVRPVPASPSIPSHDVVVDATRGLWFRIYLPKPSYLPAEGGVTSSPLPVVVYFHGGGFTILSPASGQFDSFCRSLSRHLPAAVISVNFRLAPEHRYPAQYDDGIDVLRFLDEAPGSSTNGSDLGIASLLRFADLSRCYVAGDSAGANITHHVARRWTAEPGGGGKQLRLVVLILIQPFFGGEERTGSEIRLQGAPMVNMKWTDWMWRSFLPEGCDRDHEAVNVFGPNEAKLGEEFPPAAVVVGGFDPLQDWQRRYVHGLWKRGKTARLIEYPDGIHSFHLFPEIPLGKVLVEDLRDFIYGEKEEENSKCYKGQRRVRKARSYSDV